MKVIIAAVLLALLALGAPSPAAGQEVQPDSLGLPGDNLNLYAVLKLFQESPTIEEFEQTLNEEESRINNLDLNGDGETDYIRVVDRGEGSLRAFILQVPVSEQEVQDVAVIQVEKEGEGKVTVQVIGDEELYGKDYIIEPRMGNQPGAGRTPNPAYVGAASDTNLSLDGKTVIINNTTTYEVARWPIVQFVYLPAYVPWSSPWYWGYYPPWWRPWRQWYWHQYYGFHFGWHYHYLGHYHRWPHYRHPWARVHYPVRYRSVAVSVTTRRTTGGFRSTYSRPDLGREGRETFDRVVPEAVRPRSGAARPGERPSAGGRPAGKPDQGVRPGGRPTGRTDRGVRPGGRPEGRPDKGVRQGGQRPATRPGREARPAPTQKPPSRERR
jgi:hypothetical protein